MKRRALAATLAPALLALAACSSGPAEDPQPDTAPSAGPKVAEGFDPADFGAVLATAASHCPDAISVDSLERHIDLTSNWQNRTTIAGGEGVAGLTAQTWSEYGTGDRNDPAASIDALAALACDSADKIRDKHAHGELAVHGVDALAPEGDKVDAELAALTWAVVLGGEGYVLDRGGVDLADPHIGEPIRVTVGQKPVYP